MMRHVTRMHDDQGNVVVENVIESSQENTEPPKMTIEPNVEPPQEITAKFHHPGGQRSIFCFFSIPSIKDLAPI